MLQPEEKVLTKRRNIQKTKNIQSLGELVKKFLGVQAHSNVI